MKKTTTLFLLIICTLSLMGQNASIDELKKQLSESTPESFERVDLLHDLTGKYFQENMDSAFYFVNQALLVSENIEYKQGLAKSNKLLGIYYYFEFDYQKAVSYYTKALDIYNKIHLLTESAKCTYNIGLCYWRQSLHDQAIAQFNKALQNFELQGNKALKAECLNNIGLVYWNQGEYQQALDYYNKSLSIFEDLDMQIGSSRCLFNMSQIYLRKGNYNAAFDYCNKSLRIVEKLSDKARIATRLNLLGLIHFNQKNYGKSIFKYKRALQINQEIGKLEGIGSCLNNLGLSHWKNGDLKNALKNCTEALGIFKEISFKAGMVDAHNNIGLIYLEEQNKKLALNHLYQALDVSESIGDKERISSTLFSLGSIYVSTKDYDKALQYSLKGLEIAETMGLLKTQRNLREQLSEIYASQKIYDKAYSNHVLYKALNDSIFNEENVKQLAMFEYQFELDKTKEAIALEQERKDIINEEKSKRQELISTIFLVCFVLMTILAVIAFKSYVQKQRANKLLAMQKTRMENAYKTQIAQKKEIQKIAQDLSISNQTKDKFFSIIAHDLRSPIASIMSFGELLWDESNEINEQNKKKYIEIIASESKLTLNLLDNLLNWAGSNSGRISAHPEHISINEIVDENLQFFKALSNIKNIRLQNSIKGKIEAYADYEMINTAVRNLVSNAIKFTSSGGLIEVKSRNGASNCTEIGISDSGIGMEEETMANLFKENSNFSTPGTRNEKGSGLGLQLCKEFIEKNEGNIYVESEKGVGTTFWFSLPLE
ncbi:tetratricopeptide repeat-containing sensor histidine kinase [Marinifilum caeruleilacunae]|nr:tetratricopeptide repeat protein [Marinifilum caeruleilacunae]